MIIIIIQKHIMFKKIKKRNNQIVEFDVDKISNAICKAGEVTGEFGKKEAKQLTIKVVNLAQNTIKEEIPTVEQIQDIVEEILLSSPYRQKRFQKYRH